MKLAVYIHGPQRGIYDDASSSVTSLKKIPSINIINDKLSQELIARFLLHFFVDNHGEKFK